jgi:hypothetical protein
MKRQSRDGCLAVVHPDCDVLQKGAVCDAVQSEQPLSSDWLRLEGGKRAKKPSHAGLGCIESHLYGAMFCLSSNPDLPAPVLGNLPIFPRRAGKHTIAMPYAPHLTRTDRLPV